MSASMIVLVALATLAGERPYLGTAEKAANWIWDEIFLTDQKGDPSLYSGTAGVVVFFSELAVATKSEKRKEQNTLITHVLVQQLMETTDCGLYTGLCGGAFALECASRGTGDPSFKVNAAQVMDRVVELATPAGAGVEWSPSNDIVSGSAGIGCTLLWAANALDRPGYIDIAKKVGDRLIELSKKRVVGCSWPMDPTFARDMPNFSHGTAGVAYFLAQLYRSTKDEKYLEAAKQGAAYLMSVTNKDGFVFHHEPDGKNLDYFGWCHGPVGTSRLFAILHKITEKSGYAEWIDKAGASLLKCGLPDKRSPGYWNNYGVCCGDAGMARFFLDLYRLDKKPEQLAMARRCVEYLTKKARPVPSAAIPLLESGSDGIKWTFAENRVSPEEVQAQTGLMQGAAGIGLTLLWFDGFDEKREALVRMPDAPWRW